MPRTLLDDLSQVQRDKIVLGRVLAEKDEPGGLFFKDIAKSHKVAMMTVRRWYQKVTAEDPGWKERVYADHLQKLKVQEAQKLAKDQLGLGDDVAKDFRWVLGELKRLLREGQDDDDKILQLASLRETTKVLEKLAIMMGQMNQKIDVTIDLKTSPQWLEVREVMMRTLEHHPEALPTFKRELAKMKDGPVIDHQT